MNKISRRACLQAATSAAAVLALSAPVRAEPLPPLATSLKAEETAILLIDFQGNFTAPDGTWYGRLKEHYAKTRMLERTVELVKKARAKGVLVVHVTEGYSQDFRELDATNPGNFHRSQINRSAWKVGSKEAAYYEPLRPGPGDRDLFLPPRIQASGFGGTGLNDILRAKGIKNVAVGGFTTEVCVYATVQAAYDLGYHVYALQEAMVGLYDGLNDRMINSLYPMWSQVIDNDDFDKMIESAPAPRKAAANQ